MSWLWIIGLAVVGYVVYKYVTTDHFTMPASTGVIIGVCVFAVLLLAVYFTVFRP